jgi:hypothetical protein
METLMLKYVKRKTSVHVGKKMDGEKRKNY